MELTPRTRHGADHPPPANPPKWIGAKKNPPKNAQGAPTSSTLFLKMHNKSLDAYNNNDASSARKHKSFNTMEGDAQQSA